MIFAEDGQIKIDGVILPGVLKSIEITAGARIDEQDVEGSSTKGKQATGYEDSKINIELIVDDTSTQTKYQRLSVLQNIFRKSGQKTPIVQTIVCEDTAVRGISKVIFKSLSHKSENKKGQIPVTIEFWEYNPIIITATKSTAKAPAAVPKSTAPKVGASASMTPQYKSYLTNKRGKEPNLGGSPVIDNRTPSAHLAKMKNLPY